MGSNAQGTAYLCYVLGVSSERDAVCKKTSASFSQHLFFKDDLYVITLAELAIS